MSKGNSTQSRRDAEPEVQGVEIASFRVSGKYNLHITISTGETIEVIKCERTKRLYDSPGDAITSARHAVNGFLKGERQ